MAYARLIFPYTATVQQKLKDIAKFCTGATTSTSNLEFATQNQSTVVTTEPAGWTMADAASALESSGTATITEYRLQAPCVDTSKIKYCALSAWTSATLRQSTNNTRPGAAATTGFLYIPIGTSVSGNALVNPIWYFGTNTTGSANSSATIRFAVNLA